MSWCKTSVANNLAEYWVGQMVGTALAPGATELVASVRELECSEHAKTSTLACLLRTSGRRPLFFPVAIIPRYCTAVHVHATPAPGLAWAPKNPPLTATLTRHASPVLDDKDPDMSENAVERTRSPCRGRAKSIRQQLARILQALVMASQNSLSGGAQIRCTSCHRTMSTYSSAASLGFISTRLHRMFNPVVSAQCGFSLVAVFLVQQDCRLSN